jgi:hypothetical protein
MVVVCENYSDFLAHTLPENVQQVDRMVVVTHPNDKATQALCRKFSVDCVETTAMHDQGDAFNKGICINLGLGHLRGLGWILHLDADVVLPHNFKNLIHRARLDQKNLYGADRLNVYGYEHWMAHKHKRIPSHSEGYFIEPVKEFPMGARIIHHDFGYTPIGYFQLWHKSLGKKYPINQGNAEHTDVLFACQWARRDRVLLPEVLVYHLDSLTGPGHFGVNWNGRRTPFFGPKPPAHPSHPVKHPHHSHQEERGYHCR